MPGAVPAEGRDEGVAAHYGDLFREQRALADGTGLVDLSHRGVVTVTGERPAGLAAPAAHPARQRTRRPDQATEALILSAHGHIEHALYLVDDGETTWAHVEPGTQGALIAYLEIDEVLLPGRGRRPHRASSPSSTCRPAPSPRCPEGVVVRETPHGRDLFLPRADLESFAAERRARRPASWRYEALRVEAHRPRLGFETDHRTIPHELGWIGTAVHLQKGCYRGQETVARVQNLGKPPRRLVFLHLDGSEVQLPAARRRRSGSPRTGAEGRQLGFITTSARHHELGPIALALVKRNVPVDAALLAGDTAAAAGDVVEP